MKRNKLITAILVFVCCSVFMAGCSIDFNSGSSSRKSRDNDRHSRHERSVDDEDEDDEDEDDDDRNSRRNCSNDDDEDEVATTTVSYEDDLDDYYVDHSYVADDINFPADMDMETRSCMTAALDELDWSPASRLELEEYLTEDYIGFTRDQANDALDELEAQGLVDWNEQCYLQAVSFIHTGACSRAGLISLLSSEFGCQYTDAQATYAVNRIESEGLVDWNQEALECAREYLEYDSFTRDEMIFQLTSQFEQYTQAEAEYACDQIGLR